MEINNNILQIQGIHIPLIQSLMYPSRCHQLRGLLEKRSKPPWLRECFGPAIPLRSLAPTQVSQPGGQGGNGVTEKKYPLRCSTSQYHFFTSHYLSKKNIYINQISTNMPNTFAGSVKYSFVFVRTYEMLQAPRDDDIQTTGKMLL